MIVLFGKGDEMVKEKVRFPSSDGRHEISAVIYFDYEVFPKAVIQLSHGMCEYVERYEAVAEFFTKRGYVFAGHDHIGHGDSVPSEEYGIIYDEFVLQDLRRMNQVLKERFEGFKIIMYGHSMGSFFARWYAERYGDSIDGLILSGTAGPSAFNTLGKWVAGFVSKIHRRNYVSPLLVALSFGSYNKRISNPKHKSAWLTRDETVVERYEDDPKCQFNFTATGYHSLLKVLTHVSTMDWALALPKKLPILQIAGAEDPVGNYGKGVREVTKMMRDAGVEDLVEYIDKEGRHELHNELNREFILGNIVKWLDKRYYVEKRTD